MPAITGCCYEKAEIRFTRWLARFQLDRSRHAKARRAHPDPSALDAEFACALHELGDPGASCSGSPELQEATELLLRGARVVEDYPHSLTGRKLKGIIYHLEWLDDCSRTAFVDPRYRAFLDAIVASGSSDAILDGWCSFIEFGGDKWRQLPFCLLQTVMIGEPWGGHYDPKEVKLGSPQDLGVRRACLRLLARVAFLSAERALGSGDDHPFMALLQTDESKLYPFCSLNVEHMVHPTNQAAFLQVVYLTIFVYRRFPWAGRQQHLADVEDARVTTSPRGCWRTTPPYMFSVDRLPHLEQALLRLAALVPGFREVLAEHNLWNLLEAYCSEGRLDQRQSGENPGRIRPATPSAVFLAGASSPAGRGI